MKLLSSLLVGSLLSLDSAFAAALTAPAARPPNVLFISIDDLRPALGAYGDPLAHSPSLDAFARTARVFTRAYTQQAVCGPSRAALLTGRLPDDTGVWHNRNFFREKHPALVTLPQLFKNQGYRTLSLGKVFSGTEDEDDPASWSEPSILRAPGAQNYLLPENKRAKKKGAAWEMADVDDEAYPDGKTAKLAVDTLARLKADGQPFFLAVGFLKPHLPFNAPKKYWDLHDPAKFALPADNPEIVGAPELAYPDHRELAGYMDIPADERVTADQAQTLRHGYYACVSYTDAQVGKLLAALREHGLEENTIIVVWGDHGYSLGDAERWGKATNFELATRVPLMIRTPGMAQPGAPTGALSELVDIYPTLAELAKLTPPADLAGRSLVPVLDEPAQASRAAVLSQFGRPMKPGAPKFAGYSLRTETHRYTRWIAWKDRHTVAEELYDYTGRAELFVVERENLSGAPTHAETQKLLRLAMDEMLAQRLPKQ